MSKLTDAIALHQRAETAAWEALEGCAAALGEHARNHCYREATNASHRALNHIAEGLARRQIVRELEGFLPQAADTRLGVLSPARPTRGNPGGSGHTTASPTVGPEPLAAPGEEE